MFRLRNFVELPNGSQVPLRTITREAPSLVRRSAEHLGLCERIASAAMLSKDEHRVYVNHLVVHSAILLDVSSLLYLIRHDRIAVKRLVVQQALPDLADFGGQNLLVESGNRIRDNYLPTRFFLWFLLKLVGHTVYRRFTRPKKNQGVLVRAYVETTIRSHSDMPEQTVVFTYPFKTNFRRQLRYWRGAWAKRKPVYLMGLPYRWLDPLTLVANWFRRDCHVVQTEINAHRRHAKEIHTWGFHTVLSDSESETSGYILNSSLGRLGVKTVNVSHGVGVYGPYIFFDECEFYNESQFEYYCRDCKIVAPRFLIHSRQRNSGATSTSPRLLRASKPVLVMLKGNWDNAGKYFEDHFENEVLTRLKSIAIDLNAELLIKFHPNTRTSVRERVCRNNQARELRGPATSIEGEAIFVNTLSSVYYSSFDVGPVVFAYDKLQDPREFFGPGILAVELQDLKSTLEQLQLGSARDWLVAHQIQNESRDFAPSTKRRADELDVATQLRFHYHRMSAANPQ